MQKHGIIRTIYLYLFSLVGLAVLVIGLGQLIDLGLKIYIFRNADSNEMSYSVQPPIYSYDVAKTQVIDLKKQGDKCELTTDQIKSIDSWLQDYNNWLTSEKGRAKIDYVRQRRESQASSAISMILIGLPLYLYHWSLIKKDRKEKEEKEV